MKNYETMTEAIRDLKQLGYGHDFNLYPEWIECRPLNVRLGPNDFHVDEVHRFEANTDPDDSAVLYAVSTPEGVKGLIVDAYGAYASTLNQAMITRLKIDTDTQH